MCSSPPLSIRVLALGLLALAGASLLLWIDREMSPLDPVAQGETVASHRLGPGPPEGTRPAQDPSLPRPRRSAETQAHDARPSPRQTVSGLLADAETGLSLADHRVILSWHPTDDAPTRVEARTDSGGAFRFELPPPWWKLGRYYYAQVLDAAGREIFRGQLLLASEISLVVRRRPRLAGRLETQPPIDYEGVLLRAWTPPTQALETELLCGETRLSSDGSFVVEIDESLQSDELLFVFADHHGAFADATVPRATLDSRRAPPIVRRLVELEVSVRDHAGRPAAGARLRVIPSGLPGEVRWNVRHADREGRARLRLQVGTYQVLADYPEHRPIFESVTLDAPPLDRHLTLGFERERPGDRVAGEVLGHDGRPVAGARVELFPATSELVLGRASVAAGTSDAQGRFELMSPGDAPFLLIVSHPDHGRIELAPRLASDGEVVVRFLPLGRVQVRPSGLAIDGAQSSGPMQWFLIGEDERRVLSGYSNGCPWTIEGVVTGAYRLLVMAHGQGAYGEAPLEVRLGELCTVAPSLVPANSLLGLVETIETLPVSGLQVRLLHPHWPAEVLDAWGSAETDAEGRFELFAGDLADGVVVIRQEERELMRVKLGTGARQRIRVTE